MRTLAVWIGLFFLFTFGLSFKTIAQNTDVLDRAKQAYVEGHLEQVKTILNAQGLQTLDKKEDKIEAYYYLTLVNLYLNDKNEAKKTMLSLLNTEPEYVVEPTAPQEFKSFYQTFKVSPVVIVGLKAGGDLSQAYATKTFSVDNSQSSRGTYQPNLGYQVGGVLIFHINKWLEISTELWYRSLKYQFKDKLLNYADLTFTEKRTQLEIPLLLKFNFRNQYDFFKNRKIFKNRLNPYIMAGGAASLLLSASGAARRDDVGADTAPLTIQSELFNMKSMRQNNYYYAVAAFGIEYKRSRSILAIEARYQYNFNNIINAFHRFDNNELLFKYGYVDNDLLLHNFSFSISYMYPLYHARQKKIYSRQKARITKISHE